jgi:hypothetical protein
MIPYLWKKAEMNIPDYNFNFNYTEQELFLFDAANDKIPFSEVYPDGSRVTWWFDKSPSIKFLFPEEPKE